MSKILVFILAALAGALGGFYAAAMADGWSTLLLLAELWFAYFLQVVLHEGGHLLFGRLSGYGMTSFRVGRWILLRREGKWTLSRYQIPGTGGQCLMCPPDGEDYPVLLYNLGGGLFNLMLSALAGLLLWRVPLPPLAEAFFVLFAVFGVVIGLTNLIPLRVGGLDNDGRNALVLAKNPDSRWAFAAQLRINAAQAQGRTLSDFPEEFFAPLKTADWNNPLIGAAACIYAGRRMEQGDFAGAKADLDRLLACPALSQLLRYESLLEQRCCRRLLGERALESLDRQTQKFRKSTRPYFISRCRQEYVLALLEENDLEKAQKLRDEFEKRAQKYPYPGETAGERKMLDRTLALFQKSSKSGT